MYYYTIQVELDQKVSIIKNLVNSLNLNKIMFSQIKIQELKNKLSEFDAYVSNLSNTCVCEVLEQYKF